MPSLEEWSTNFDTENVVPFLQRIAQHIESGFADPEIAQVLKLIETMKVDDEKHLTFEIRYAGQLSDFKIGVFLDDIDAPDLYFFAPAGLCKQLSAEMQKFAEERGM
jgi:hypothetical protein